MDSKEGYMRNPVKFEPAVLGAFVMAGVSLVVAFGAKLTDVQMASISSFVSLGLALFVRQSVTPTAKL
jgi:hypothetical protein